METEEYRGPVTTVIEDAGASFATFASLNSLALVLPSIIRYSPSRLQKRPRGMRGKYTYQTVFKDWQTKLTL